MFTLKPELHVVRKKHGLYVMIVTMKGCEFGMAINEWIQKGSVSDEIAKKRGLVELVRCKDCKHRPKEPNLETYESGFDLEFPEGSKCPCLCCGDEWYSWYPEDDWFCANGERQEGR